MNTKEKDTLLELLARAERVAVRQPSFRSGNWRRVREGVKQIACVDARPTVDELRREEAEEMHRFNYTSLLQSLKSCENRLNAEADERKRLAVELQQEIKERRHLDSLYVQLRNDLEIEVKNRMDLRGKLDAETNARKDGNARNARMERVLDARIATLEHDYGELCSQVGEMVKEAKELRLKIDGEAQERRALDLAWQRLEKELQTEREIRAKADDAADNQREFLKQRDRELASRCDAIAQVLKGCEDRIAKVERAGVVEFYLQPEQCEHTAQSTVKVSGVRLCAGCGQPRATRVGDGG